MVSVFGGVKVEPGSFEIRGELLKEGEPTSGIVIMVNLSSGSLSLRFVGSNGRYQFPVPNKYSYYSVIGLDMKGEFKAVIADRVIPAPYGS